MKVKLFVKGVIWQSDVFERTVEIRSEEDYIDPDDSHLFRRVHDEDFDVLNPADEPDKVHDLDVMDPEGCSGDCDNCDFAYYETDHGYAYEESKLHCKMEESK